MLTKIYKLNIVQVYYTERRFSVCESISSNQRFSEDNYCNSAINVIIEYCKSSNFDALSQNVASFGHKIYVIKCTILRQPYFI